MICFQWNDSYWIHHDHNISEDLLTSSFSSEFFHLGIFPSSNLSIQAFFHPVICPSRHLFLHFLLQVSMSGMWNDTLILVDNKTTISSSDHGLPSCYFYLLELCPSIINYLSFQIYQHNQINNLVCNTSLGNVFLYCVFMYFLCLCMKERIRMTFHISSYFL